MKVLRANEAAASISAAVQALNEANVGPPTSSQRRRTYRSLRDGAQRRWRRSRQQPRHSRPRWPPSHRGRAKSSTSSTPTTRRPALPRSTSGAPCPLAQRPQTLTEELARLPRSLEKLGRTFPPVEEATDGLASAIAEWLWRLSQRSDGGIAPPRSCPTGIDAAAPLWGAGDWRGRSAATRRHRIGSADPGLAFGRVICQSKKERVWSPTSRSP